MAKKTEAGALVMNGCGHCDKMLPDWQQFSKDNQGNFNGIKITTIESADLGKHGLDGKVSGFPSFYSKDANGNIEIHDGIERSIDGFNKWFGGMSGEPEGEATKEETRIKYKFVSNNAGRKDHTVQRCLS